MQEQTENHCPECNSNLIHDPTTGETICQTCGLVVKENELTLEPEYRAYNFQEAQERSRVGKPATLLVHDKGLTTVMSTFNRDAHGKQLTGAAQAQAYRLRKWQNRCRITATEKSLFLAMADLDKFADKLHAPTPTRERAAYLVHKALAAGLARGRTIEGLTAGCLYMACRQTNVLRSLDELAHACVLRRKQVSACYRLLLNSLQVSTPPLTNPSLYIGRVCGMLGVSADAQKEAYRVLQALADTNVFSGKDPRAVAASVLYVACERVNKYDVGGNLVTQKRLAAAIGITEVTIRNRYHELENLVS